MEMISVNSNNISSIGYEDNVLYVRFHTGALYAYSGVPSNVYVNLMNASSHGSYFAKFIKGVYPYHRLS